MRKQVGLAEWTTTMPSYAIEMHSAADNLGNERDLAARGQVAKR
jgi:hypothetical protein